ncbi:MAG TPA: hypothetical protein VG266_06065, partial [Candidatus Dormibacteraeota bacterium]|nr:hypothetical protein [Candidatus Dormibacteraeota bacterium]
MSVDPATDGKPSDSATASGNKSTLCVVAQAAVDHHIAPGPAAEAALAQQPLTAERALLERALFGDVVGLGERDQPVRWRRREQVLGEQALGH